MKTSAKYFGIAVGP